MTGAIIPPLRKPPFGEVVRKRSGPSPKRRPAFLYAGRRRRRSRALRGGRLAKRQAIIPLPCWPLKFTGGSPHIVSTSQALFRLASRLDEVGFSDIVAIRNKIMELRASGATVYQFEGGEPYSNTPDYIKDAMTRALNENRTRYAPSSGIMELRAAIADKLRERNRMSEVRDDHVIVLNGGMQGLFGAFQSVVNPGEEVMVFSPYWTPIKDLIAHCQGAPVLVPTKEARRD